MTDKRILFEQVQHCLRAPYTGGPGKTAPVAPPVGHTAPCSVWYSFQTRNPFLIFMMGGCYLTDMAVFKTIIHASPLSAVLATSSQYLTVDSNLGKPLLVAPRAVAGERECHNNAGYIIGNPCGSLGLYTGTTSSTSLSPSLPPL